MDDDLNLARRHRFGATASDTLQARIDITESDAEQFEPEPLTSQQADGRAAAAWFVIILATAGLAWIGWAALISWLESLG